MKGLIGHRRLRGEKLVTYQTNLKTKKASVYQSELRRSADVTCIETGKFDVPKTLSSLRQVRCRVSDNVITGIFYVPKRIFSSKI